MNQMAAPISENKFNQGIKLLQEGFQERISELLHELEEWKTYANAQKQEAESMEQQLIESNNRITELESYSNEAKKQNEELLNERQILIHERDELSMKLASISNFLGGSIGSNTSSTPSSSYNNSTGLSSRSHHSSMISPARSLPPNFSNSSTSNSLHLSKSIPPPNTNTNNYIQNNNNNQNNNNQNNNSSINLKYGSFSSTSLSSSNNNRKPPNSSSNNNNNNNNNNNSGVKDTPEQIYADVRSAVSSSEYKKFIKRIRELNETGVQLSFEDILGDHPDLLTRMNALIASLELSS